METVERSQLFRQEVTKMLDTLLLIIRKMPFAQGVITCLAGGITFGTLSFGHLDVISEVTQAIAVAVVFLLGGLTLYLLRRQRSKDKRLLSVGVVLMIAANLLYLFDTDRYTFQFVHSLALISISVSLFLAALHEYDYPAIEERDEESSDINST